MGEIRFAGTGETRGYPYPYVQENEDQLYQLSRKEFTL